MTRIVYLGNPFPITSKAGALGRLPVPLSIQAKWDTTTVVRISPDSTMMQAIAEIKTIWKIHSNSASPTWVGFSEEARAIANLIVSEYGGTAVLKEGVFVP